MMALHDVRTRGKSLRGGVKIKIYLITASINEMDLTDKRVGIDKIKNYDDK